jgi:hypothetical protein
MYDDIKNKINELSNSPLFYMFSSSKELFHSNFWYWLTIENRQQSVKLFCNNKAPAENIMFKREFNFKYENYKSKVDLAIFEKQQKKKKLTPVCIIENKIKDYPTNNQLTRIQKSVNKSNGIEYLLITLIPMDDQLLPTGWVQITYRELAERMDNTKFKYVDNFNNELIQKYISFIKNLSEMAYLLPHSNTYDFAKSFDKELFNTLNNVKLWELYSKWRASEFTTFIFEYLSKRKNISKPIPIYFGITNEENKPYIYVDYGVNNQKATITMRLVITPTFEVGIQIEDNQYRKFLVLEKVKIKNIDNFINNNFWFNDKFRGKGTKEKEEKSTLKYDGKNLNTCFRYQYEQIKIDSFTNLAERIYQDMTFIIGNIEEFKKLNH